MCMEFDNIYKNLTKADYFKEANIFWLYTLEKNDGEFIMWIR